MVLPYDPEDPPARPPAGADPLTWRLAYQVLSDHRRSPFGACRSPLCEHADWPCRPARLAGLGLRTALGARAPWSTLNRSRRWR